MGEKLHRTQILLEPHQHSVLTRIAREEGRSISDIVREMVREQLDRREQAANARLARQLAALERIRQHREQILAELGGRSLDLDTVKLIDEMREEQDVRALGGLDTGSR